MPTNSALQLLVTCTGCKQARDSAEFRSKSGKTRYAKCLSCRREYYETYGKNHPEWNSKQVARRKANPERLVFDRVQAKAKKLGIPFNLSLKDIFIPKHCPILGIELTAPGAGQTEASPSVDRLKPSLGYVSGNVWIISNRANRLKNDATVEELERIAAWMRAHGAS